jgi:hypothetical protein
MGSPAAGYTLNELPTTRNREHSRAARKQASSTSGRSDWPNETVAVFRMPPQCAVDLQYRVRPLACGLVQPVDVLGDQGTQPPGAFQVDQRVVAGIRLRLPGGVGQPRLPDLAPHGGIGQVGAQIGPAPGRPVP